MLLPNNPCYPIQSEKIIHIDMDCFYAAIEIRDNPALANKPPVLWENKTDGNWCTLC